MFIYADFALPELTDEEFFRAIAIEVGPAGRGIAGGFDADGGIACHETDGGLKVPSARPSCDQAQEEYW
jgi:hypothetical protein